MEFGPGIRMPGWFAGRAYCGVTACTVAERCAMSGMCA